MVGGLDREVGGAHDLALRHEHGAFDGVVEFAGQQNGYGNVIHIRHDNNRMTVYAHLSRIGVRVGTLDEPARLPPDVHVFTSTKLPWVTLPEGVPAVPAFYDRKQVWSAESLARREAILPLLQDWLAKQGLMK